MALSARRSVDTDRSRVCFNVYAPPSSVLDDVGILSSRISFSLVTPFSLALSLFFFRSQPRCSQSQFFFSTRFRLFDRYSGRTVSDREVEEIRSRDLRPGMIREVEQLGEARAARRERDFSLDPETAATTTTIRTTTKQQNGTPLREKRTNEGACVREVSACERAIDTRIIASLALRRLYVRPSRFSLLPRRAQNCTRRGRLTKV